MKTKPITLRFEQEDYDLAIEHSGMKIQALVNRLVSDYTAQFKQPLIIPVPYERITDELKDHLKLDKEGSKPYKPKTQDQNISYLQKRQQQKLK